MPNQKTAFSDLPSELLFNLFLHLSPEILFKASPLNKGTQAIIKDNLFWKQKFEQHFPHLVNPLLTKTNIHWYAQFRETYENEYSQLPSSIRTLFSLVKENDIESLKKRELFLSDFHEIDNNGNSLIEWAKKINNQTMLDYFYQVIKKNHMRGPSHAPPNMSYWDRAGGFLLKVAECVNNLPALVNLYYVYVLTEARIDVEKKDKKGRTILYWAITLRQSAEEVAWLFSRGSAQNEYYDGTYPLFLAIQENRLDIVKLFKNVLNQCNRDLQTPLILAAQLGHEKIVDYLLTQEEVNLYQSDLKWQRALHFAASKGHLNIVKALIEKPHHVYDVIETKDKFKRTPLLLAAAGGHGEVVEYLIKKNADVNVKSSGPTEEDKEKTPLYYAACEGHSNVVALLMGARAQMTELNGKYPIHAAAILGHESVVRTLLDNQPDLLEKTDYSNQTALLWAADSGHHAIVTYLLGKGADLTIATAYARDEENGKTPLYWAASKGHSKVVEILLNASANIETTVNRLSHPIHIAIENGHLNVVEVLINAQPSLLEKRDSHDGHRPLIRAALKGHALIVDYLIRKGADLNATTHLSKYPYPSSGKTALYWASYNGHANVVLILIKASAQTTSPLLPQQAIHIAAEKGYLDVVSTLIENEPPLLESKDCWGHTPLFWAAKASQEHVIRYLLITRGANINIPSLLSREKEKNNYDSGVIYYKKDQFANAVLHFSLVLYLNPVWNAAYHYRGKAYIQLGLFHAAVQDFTYLLKTFRMNASLYNERGFAYKKLGMLEKALSDFNRAISNDPAFLEAYSNRADVFYALGELDKAISDYDWVLEQDPNNADIYNKRGIAYEAKGMSNQANADFIQLFKLNSTEKDYVYAALSNNGFFSPRREEKIRHLDNVNNEKETLFERGNMFGL